MEMKKTTLTFLLLVAAWPSPLFAQVDENPAEEDGGTTGVNGEDTEKLPEAVEKRFAELKNELEALREENAQNLRKLKEEMSNNDGEEEDYAAVNVEKEEERVSRLLEIYGFFDVTFYKYFYDHDSGFHLFLNDKPSFVVSSLNLYLKSQMTDTLSALAELRFAFMPFGNAHSYAVEIDTIDTGETYDIIDEDEGFSYRDPVSSQTYYPGSVSIERIHLTWSPRDWFNILAGYYLTPYGIWNIEHGSPVVLPARLPYMQIRRMAPQTQTGLQVFGRFFPRYNLYLDYAVTLSNGRQELMESTFDLDNNKGVGLRLRGMYEGDNVTVALGGYGYYGRLTRDQKSVIVNTQEQTLKVDVEHTWVNDEAVVTGDFLLKFFGVKLQMEYIFRYIKAVVPRTFLYSDELFLAGDLTGTVTGEPVYFGPTSVGRGYYGLLAYELPLHQWLGDFTITPYVLYESNMTLDSMPQINMKHLVYAGINLRPSAYVVLKAEFNYIVPEANKYGRDLMAVIAQMAVSF